MILITFSYAIVGLILDVSMFLSSLIASLFKGMFIDAFGNSWVFTFWEKISAMLSPEEVHEIVRPFADAFAIGGLAATTLFITFLGTGFLIVPIFIGLIIALLLAIAYIKALWVLLKAFAMIVLNIVFGPFRILIGILPGTNGIAGWFKDILANVAVLPGMLAIFLLGNFLIIQGPLGAITTLSKGPEGFGIYGLFWIASSLIIPLIGIVILLMIPKITDMIQAAITKKPFDYGTAIGQAMGPGTAPLRAGAGMVRDYTGKVAGGLAATTVTRITKGWLSTEKKLDKDAVKTIPKR